MKPSVLTDDGEWNGTKKLGNPETGGKGTHFIEEKIRKTKRNSVILRLKY